MFRTLFAAALGCLCVCAQETVHLASISGTVSDTTGAVLITAQIAARNVATNTTVSMVTDREGRYRFPYLRPGEYELRVHRTGFADTSRTVTVSAGNAYEMPFTLSVDGAGTTLEVKADAPLVDTNRSAVAGSVSEAEVRHLPLNGRNFLDLALLIPGVSPTNTGSNQLYAETSAVPGQGISFASQRNLSNNFVVDGLSANDDAAGLSGIYFGLDTVQEVQVVTSGAQAELGRALGGFVNVVTRSGSNTLHGDLFGFFRNQRFNAANKLSGQKLPLTQAQYGASIGGPLVHDRTFYFANFERRDLNQSGLTTITPENAATINSRLDAVAYAGPRVTTGVYGNPVHSTNVLAKVDHTFGTRDQFSLRYSSYGVSSDNSRGAGGLSAESASTALNNLDQSVAISNIHTFSPGTVMETRGQFTHSDLNADPTDPSGPAVSIAGIATFGRSTSSPTARANYLYELVNNISHTAGKHALRAGAQLVVNDDTITYPRAARGSYSFPSLGAFLAGTYNNSGFTQTFGRSVIPQLNQNVGLYVQDEWKIRPSLTLNAGLRYDLQFLQTIATDTNNVSPRIGFAWSPFKDTGTVVRGSFGMFYDRIPLRALANALLSSSNTTLLTPDSQVSVSLSPTQAGAPVFPQVLTILPSAVLPNYSTMNRAIQNAYSTQTSFEVEQHLGRSSMISVGYLKLRGIHLIASINQNVPACAAAGSNNGCRPNTAYANNSQYSAAGDSWYDGLHVSFQQRTSRWGSYRVSYAYSKSLNDVGEFFFSSPIDPYNIWRDKGRSDDDQRHRLVASGQFQAPFGFSLSGIVQYYSALPFNITSGANTIQGTPARPLQNGDFIPRNSGTGPDYINVSSRVSRVFRFGDSVKLEALAEAFNLLNRTNVLTVNGVFGGGAYPANPSPAFGTRTAVQDSRTVEFGLRIVF